jgi:hypothetical protein
VGFCKFRLLKTNENGEATCQIRMYNNLRKLVLNARVLEGVKLNYQKDTKNAFSVKLWSVTEVCAMRTCYCVKFVGDNAKVNSNTFKFIWAIYSGTAEAEVRASGFDEVDVTTTVAATEEIEVQIDTEVAEGEAAGNNESSDVDELSDDELSENLLVSSDDESGGDDKVDMNCHFKNFTLHDEWDGEAVDKSQGF